MRNGKSTERSGSPPANVSNRTADPARAPLSVATDLTLEINGGTADVESTGQRLFVRFRSIPDAIRAARGRPDRSAIEVAELLAVTDLTLEVRVRDRTVTAVGAEARPGTVSRFLGVDPFEVRIGGVLGAVTAEVSAAVETVSRFLD